MANECIPFKEPGSAVTAQATAAVVGKRFVRISGNRTSGPGLSATAEGGNYRVATANAAVRAFGVARRDAATGEKLGVWTQPGIIVPVFAEAAIAADAEVQVGAAGGVVPLAAGVAVGRCLSAALINTDAEIKLY